jgi:hypothetical protein
LKIKGKAAFLAGWCSITRKTKIVLEYLFIIEHSSKDEHNTSTGPFNRRRTFASTRSPQNPNAKTRHPAEKGRG